MLQRWLTSQRAFMETLPLRYKYALQLYSYTEVRYSVYKLCSNCIRDIQNNGYLYYFPVEPLYQYMSQLYDSEIINGVGILIVLQQLIADLQYIIMNSPPTINDLFAYSMNVCENTVLYTHSFQHSILPMVNKPPLFQHPGVTVKWYKIKIPKGTHVLSLFSTDARHDKEYVENIFPIGGTFQTIVENNGITLVDYISNPTEIHMVIESMIMNIRSFFSPPIIPKKIQFSRKTYAEIASSPTNDKEFSQLY